ncbi:type I-C CRISPR-associated protein Cas8c/Csd1 [Anaerobranca gottschalkii]|uniref:CRISPR-associated protein Csd1 n=1 Tax=Anaerobranca gottschalkii DSM 13577 TaxID=1120990 RepID=A0A1I0BBL7_9FIRM|nr:type I-C CRISPR-associated protein Cas8c/Csd1 [Anaerobranca gottschalkii]SET03557.1 CRISPR-associated protein Csd1 [Anaerobranca gottschalkii DSM 13577]
MILQSLVEFYNLLSGDEEIDIPRLGYSIGKVKLVAIISGKGELLDIVPLNDNPKSFENMVVPEQKGRNIKLLPYFLCDKSEYVFGWKFDVKPYAEKFDYFSAFKELHREILQGLNNKKAQALLEFLENWQTDYVLHHSVIKNKVDILEKYNGNIVFRIDGETGYIHEDKEILAKWENYYNQQFFKEGSLGQCLVNGIEDVIERTHPKITGVAGANPAGASLISVNANAYESYNKTQGFNSPIGKRAAFSYGAALNFMLNNSRHKIVIGDFTLVFWAYEKSGNCESLLQELLFPGSIEAENRYEPSAVEYVKDSLTALAQGKSITKDEKITFNILGLSPSNARISVRLWLKDNFGVIVNRVWQHQQDMEIIKGDTSKGNISIYKLLAETIPKKSKNEKISSTLTSNLLQSVFKGDNYPVGMYVAILNRVKIEKDVNYIRAGFIKAYLLRKARKSNIEKEGVFTVSLNEQNTNIPYRLGRLFAVLEKAQLDASGNLNSTIKDRYFASATSSPRTVFPVLLRLAQHHIAKDEYGYWKDEKIKEILQGIDVLPAHLNLEDQGLFILGYYHQKEAFYQKTKKSE